MSPPAVGCIMAKSKNTEDVAMQLAEVQRAVGDLFLISQKLKACGVLLRRQGVEHEGYAELAGLGVILEEMSDAVDKIVTQIDGAA